MKTSGTEEGKKHPDNILDEKIKTFKKLLTKSHRDDNITVAGATQ